jgi:serine/threonine protein kinase
VPGSAAPASGEAGGWGLEQRYDLLGKIGEGTYGVVYLATSKQDKKRVYAIKKFKTGRVRSSSMQHAGVAVNQSHFLPDSPLAALHCSSCSINTAAAAA